MNRKRRSIAAYYYVQKYVRKRPGTHVSTTDGALAMLRTPSRPSTPEGAANGKEACSTGGLQRLKSEFRPRGFVQLEVDWPPSRQVGLG